MAFLQEEIGHGGAEVASEGGDGVGLGRAIFLQDLEGATQDGGTLFGLKDGDEIAVDGAALAHTFVPREVLGHANGLPDVAQLVEQAALFDGIKVDRGQGGAQATPAIVNDQFQAGFAA